MGLISGERYIQIIVLLLFFIIVAALVDLITLKPLTSKPRRIRIAVLCGIGYTLITMIFLQGHSLLFEEEAKLISVVNHFPFRSHPDKNFVKDNFLFINTSLNPALTPLKEANQEDDAKRVITDREKLVNCLEDINNYNTTHPKDIDLVVVDIIFADTSKFDDSLRLALIQLERSGKLLLAYNQGIVNEYPKFYGGFAKQTFGDVTKVKEHFYFSHELINDGLPSLPYKMYLKLKEIKSVSEHGLYLQEDGHGIVFKRFITEFNFTEEEKLYERESHENDHLKNTDRPDSLEQDSEGKHVYTLGGFLDEDVQKEIFYTLKDRKKDAKRIIFVGSISDDYVDRHSTGDGVLYGATILLNEFYYIYKGYHKYSVGWMSFYVLILLSGFSIINYRLLTRVNNETTKKHNKNNKKGFFSFIGNWLLNVIGFLLDEFHELLLLALVISLSIIFHKIVNGLGLLVFYILFTALLKFYAHRRYGKEEVGEAATLKKEVKQTTHIEEKITTEIKTKSISEGGD